MAHHHEHDAARSVEEVLATEELARRPARMPDYAAENRALVRLAREMVGNPQGMLQTLAELVIELCRADSAGISVLEPGGERGSFRWWAASGLFAPNLGGTLPRDASPCGVVVERNTVLLFRDPDRFFSALRGYRPRVREGLLAPWSIDGEPIGTVWALQHNTARRFDAEDARLLTALTAFASAAWQMATALDQSRGTSAAMERQVAERTRDLRQSVVRLQQEAAQRRLAEQARMAAEGRLSAELDAMRNLYALHARLAAETDLQSALDAILATACEFTRTDRGCIQMVSGDGARLEIAAERGYAPEGAAAHIDDIRAAQSTQMISRKGGTLGVLNTQFRQPHRPSDEELRLVDLLAWAGAEFVERHRAQEALRHQSRFTETVLSSIPDFVYAFDREHRFAYVNQAMQALLGQPFERIVGRTLAELGYPPDLAEPLDRHLDAIFATGCTVEDEVLFASPAGVEGFHQFRWGPMPLDDGSVDLVVGVSRDTTERHRLEERLRESEERTAFLLRLSDSLRPLDDAGAIEETCARLVGEHLRLNRALIGEFVGGEVVVKRDWVDGVASMAGRYPVSDVTRIMMACYERGEAFVARDLANDVRMDAQEREIWAPGGIGALVSVGLLGNGRVTANFCAQSLAPRAWSEAQVSLVREAPERAWAAMERARAEQALKDADQRKDEFLATLAHELRNPLAPISNAVHLLRRPDGRRVTDRLMEIVERQVRQIVKLVDDLMEISRITRGKIELDRQPVALAAAVRDAVENSRPLVERARHQLAVDLPPEPLLIDADSVRLTQILTNLINNAAKYTDAGGRIWLSAERDGAEVAIHVRDNGLGIARDQLTRVFDMFAQAQQPGEISGSDGLGIGLAIVRKLVEMHGGTVEAYSAGPLQGSEFVVRLPLLDGADAAGAQATLERGKLAGLRILVVDDNRDAADTLALLLESHGATVLAVYDGSAALAALEHFPAQALLLDLGMPDMDGFELARRIRRDTRLAGLRIVALTGWGQQADRERTRSAGFDHHLTKPVDFNALEAWLTGTTN